MASKNNITWELADLGRRNVLPGTLIGTHVDHVGYKHELTLTPVENVEGYRGWFELIMDEDYVNTYPDIVAAGEGAYRAIDRFYDHLDASGDFNKPISDKSAMDQIHELMDGNEWNADTLDRIAELVRFTGRAILEPMEIR